jgi:hypothetical protein
MNWKISRFHLSMAESHPLIVLFAAFFCFSSSNVGQLFIRPRLRYRMANPRLGTEGQPSPFLLWVQWAHLALFGASAYS